MTMKPQPDGMHREARQDSRRPDPAREGKLLPADEYDIFDGKEHAGVTQRAKGGWRGLPDGVPLPDGNLPPVHKTHGVAMQYIRDQRAKLAAASVAMAGNGQGQSPGPVPPPPPAAPVGSIDTGELAAETESITVVQEGSPEADPGEPLPVQEKEPEAAPETPVTGDDPGPEYPEEGLLPEDTEASQFHDPFADDQPEPAEPDLAREFPFA